MVPECGGVRGLGACDRNKVARLLCTLLCVRPCAQSQSVAGIDCVSGTKEKL